MGETSAASRASMPPANATACSGAGPAPAAPRGAPARSARRRSRRTAASGASTAGSENHWICGCCVRLPPGTAPIVATACPPVAPANATMRRVLLSPPLCWSCRAVGRARPAALRSLPRNAAARSGPRAVGRAGAGRRSHTRAPRGTWWARSSSAARSRVADSMAALMVAAAPAERLRGGARPRAAAPRPRGGDAASTRPSVLARALGPAHRRCRWRTACVRGGAEPAPGRPRPRRRGWPAPAGSVARARPGARARRARGRRRHHRRHAGGLRRGAASRGSEEVTALVFARTLGR